MRWTIHLEGGPKRVNHAAVAIGKRIYSFGGYCSDELNPKDPIDVHVLNTETYRWQKISSSDSRKRKVTTLAQNKTNERNAEMLISTNNSFINYLEQPTFSNASPPNRRHRSDIELHPLTQLRHFRPPLDDNRSYNEFPIELQGTAILEEESSNNIRQDITLNQEMPINIVNNQLENDLHFMDVDDFILNVSDDYDDSLSEINENEIFGNDGINFIDGDEDGEDYDDFDFNYHNLPVSPQSRQSFIVQNNLLPDRNDFDSVFIERPHLEVPYLRYGHTVVTYNGKAYLWGGRSDKFRTSSVLHEFDPVTCKWTIVKCNSLFIPPPRDGHSAVVYGDSMYIFGGFEEQFHRFSQDTFAFHFPSGTWQLLKTENEPPQNRDFHTACVIDDKMYVFGGRSDEAGYYHSNKDKYCSKLKCLDLKKLRWAEVKTTGDPPCGRRSHSVWVYNKKMYIFGGYSSFGDKHFNDLREFNTETNEWRLITPSCGIDSIPSARRRQCTVIVGTKVFLFGGTMPFQSKKNNRSLIELSDLNVLDFQPSLASLSAEAFIRYGLNERYDHFLPAMLRKEIRYMNMPNSISKSSKLRIGCSNG